MDEQIDILDENGNYTGKSCLKSEAHKNGYFHPTVHIWLFTSDEKILLQKRAMTKKVFPGLWDISVAGHIGAGEEIISAAIREVKEEIGLCLQPNNLIKIGTRKHMVSHANGIQDNEFHHVFIAKLTSSLGELIIQKEEVDELKLFDLSVLKNIKNLKNILLPKFYTYYCFVHDKIKKQLC